MYKDKKILALITARGGSKGIPKKNIKLLGNKPLIVWTIESALSSKFIDKTILSSDCDEIIDIAKSNGCEIPFKRPCDLAKDESSSIDVILHALSFYKDYDYLSYDFLVVLNTDFSIFTIRGSSVFDEEILIIGITNFPC
jgi:N-acylneuraminate cytidylyltransferase